MGDSAAVCESKYPEPPPNQARSAKASVLG